ncbi:MAG: sigma-70 family RNA polymerase sigma factor, partial [Gammaproteobacteria bacterium]|nr:sigma-70 family RNA polymerase sigma factor [Gammaproteobacteria bacterium]
GADNDNDDNCYSPSVYLPIEQPGPQELVVEDDWQRSMQSTLFAALETIDERSRDIIESRWISDRKQTLRELADRYGVSAERIRQIEANALRKLRDHIGA